MTCSHEWNTSFLFFALLAHVLTSEFYVIRRPRSSVRYSWLSLFSDFIYAPSSELTFVFQSVGVWKMETTFCFLVGMCLHCLLFKVTDRIVLYAQWVLRYFLCISTSLWLPLRLRPSLFTSMYIVYITSMNHFTCIVYITSLACILYTAGTLVGSSMHLICIFVQTDISQAPCVLRLFTISCPSHNDAYFVQFKSVDLF